MLIRVREQKHLDLFWISDFPGRQALKTSKWKGSKVGANQKCARSIVHIFEISCRNHQRVATCIPCERAYIKGGRAG